MNDHRVIRELVAEIRRLEGELNAAWDAASDAEGYAENAFARAKHESVQAERRAQEYQDAANMQERQCRQAVADLERTQRRLRDRW